MVHLAFVVGMILTFILNSRAPVLLTSGATSDSSRFLWELFSNDTQPNKRGDRETDRKKEHLGSDVLLHGNVLEERTQQWLRLTLTDLWTAITSSYSQIQTLFDKKTIHLYPVKSVVENCVVGICLCAIFRAHRKVFRKFACSWRAWDLNECKKHCTF